MIYVCVVPSSMPQDHVDQLVEAFKTMEGGFDQWLLIRDATVHSPEFWWLPEGHDRPAMDLSELNLDK